METEKLSDLLTDTQLMIRRFGVEARLITWGSPEPPLEFFQEFKLEFWWGFLRISLKQSGKIRQYTDSEEEEWSCTIFRNSRNCEDNCSFPAHLVHKYCKSFKQAARQAGREKGRITLHVFYANKFLGCNKSSWNIMKPRDNI